MTLTLIIQLKDFLSKLKKTPITYIGGKPDEARATFWEQEPVMQHAVDSIAKQYGINSDALKYRLNREGFVDSEINSRNNALKRNKNIERGYDLLNGEIYNSGAQYFGLDDVGSLITDKKVNLINENWYDEDFENEKCRHTHAVVGKTTADNIGISAATLKYFTDIAKQDNPNISDYDANRYGLAYYNRGVVGGRKWVKSGAKGYNYKRSLENGGKII